MRILLILSFVLINCLSYADEFEISKDIDANIVKIIQQATGLNLEGKNQSGYLTISDGKIEVKLYDRELTQEEKQKIEDIISNYKPETDEEKKVRKQAKIDKVRIRLGLSESEWIDLKEALGE